MLNSAKLYRFNPTECAGGSVSCREVRSVNALDDSRLSIDHIFLSPLVAMFSFLLFLSGSFLTLHRSST